MVERAELSASFEALRPYFVRVAYGTLGELGEAQDVVQEAWLRLERVVGHTATLQDQRRLVEAFAVPCMEGDLERLVETLDEDVVWRSDGGGQVPAIRKPLHGAMRVAKGLLGVSRRWPVAEGTLALVNGALGLVSRAGDGVLTVTAFSVRDGRIVAVDSIRNPDKLDHVNVL